METYAAPFRDKLLKEVTVHDVAAALASLWSTRPAAAAQVRALWERVLARPDGADVGGVHGDNPAAGSPVLQGLLRPVRTARAAAVAFNDLPLMLERVRSGRGLGRLALELSVLTCIPPPDICGLTCGELRLEAQGWTVFAKTQATPGAPRRSWRAAALVGPAAERLERLPLAGGGSR